MATQLPGTPDAGPFVEDDIDEQEPLPTESGDDGD